MPTDVIMPQMGESIFEGTITKWLKKPGDQVQRDEPLFEISTDKVDAEIPSPAAGMLTEIKVGEGSTVQINTVVAVLSENGAAAASCSRWRQSLKLRLRKRMGIRPPRRRPSLRLLRRRRARPSTLSCRRWASRSSRARLPSGSRKSATPSRRMSRCSRFRRIRSMRRFRRRLPARSPRSRSRKATPSRSIPSLR